MRRILLAVMAVGMVLGVGTRSEAVTTSCADPTVVGGTGIGIDKRPDGARLCVFQDATTRYEINGSVVTYTYGTTGGIAGGTGSFCWYEGATYTCVAAGTGAGAFAALMPGDAVSVFLVPSVCETNHASYFAHCFGVFLFAGADGPLGPTSGVGGGVFVCEDDGYWFYCPVQEAEWIPLPPLKPITVTGTTPGLG